MNKQNNSILDFIADTAHNRVSNYVVPGLDSVLLENSKTRLFEATRTQQAFVTPHTHRYNLFSVVLQGWATNTIYEPATCGERFAKSSIGAEEFEYEPDTIGKIGFYNPETKTHRQGESFYLTYNQIHTIEFSKDALVLIVESPEIKTPQFILQPVNHKGDILDIFTVKDWMFKS